MKKITFYNYKRFDLLCLQSSFWLFSRICLFIEPDSNKYCNKF